MRKPILFLLFLWAMVSIAHAQFTYGATGLLNMLSPAEAFSEFI